jgi:ABC-2 type transport system ATP-binding protein
MMQKIGLMATLMSDRPLLILDEPMTGLDPQARILLKDRLLDYRRQGGSVFFSSHILSDIDEICDNVAVLNDRHIVYSGSPSDLRHRYGGANLERAFLNAIGAEEPLLETAG